MSYLLGIDVGTSGTKLLLVDPQGAPVGSLTEEYPLHSPKPGWSEQAPEDWWTAVCQGVGRLLKAHKIKGAAIGAVGLSGQMHGSVFLGRGGKVLRRALLWNDQRTTAQCEAITERAGGRAELIKLVANPALTGFTAPKILWLRDCEPARFEKLQKVLLPKDYIRWKLTGQFATEVSDASGTLLLDVRQRAWSRPLLERLGLDAALLPPVHESTVVTGEIDPSAAQATGLAVGTPVVGGAGDCAAGAVGAGVVSPGTVSVSLGTSGVVFAPSEQADVDPAGRVHTFCHAVPGTWHTMGVMLSAAGSLQWFAQALGEPQRQEARRARRDVYELLVDEMAAAAPPGCEGLMFVPYLTGERTPHADPLARGAWVGMTRRTDKAHLIRAVIEGVCHGLRDSLAIISELGVAVDEVRALGGGARSRTWLEILASDLQCPVARLNIEEGPAYGVALLAGVGTGVWSSVAQAVKAGLKLTGRVKPRPALAKVYESHYQVWRELYPALRASFARQASLV